MRGVREWAQKKAEGVSLQHHLLEAKRLEPLPPFEGLGKFKNKDFQTK